MSALMHIGEADHKLLNVDAEIGACWDVSRSREALCQAMVRMREQITEARAALGAVRLALRAHALEDALDYHEVMTNVTRDAAKRARMVPGHGLHLQADQHAARAAALRVLIGAGTPAEGGAE